MSTPDPTDERAIFRKLRQTFHNPPWAGHGSIAAECYMCQTAATAALAALAAAGRLVPADAETEEWGWLSTDTVRVYASPSEADARRAASRSGARKLMRRRLGPWSPVPADTCATKEEA